MSEVNCEPKKICSDGSGAFKGALASDLAFVTVVAPYTASDIMPRLQGSAKGAAKACAGGKSDQNLCGQRWYSDYDGTENIIARQISATSIFTSNLVIYKSQDVATEDTADTSTASSTTGAAGAASSSASASTTSSTDGNGASALDCGWMGVNACIVAAIVAMVQAFV